MPLDQVNLTDVQIVLLDAAAEVRKGWCQHKLETADGRVCVRGAIMRANDNQFLDLGWGRASPIEQDADWLLSLHLGIDAYISDVPDWNDVPGRTAEEVSAALEQAAFSNRDKIC